MNHKVQIWFSQSTRLLWIRGTHQPCCLDQILERQYTVQVGEYMGILTPNPTNIYAAFYPSNSMACFSNHFAVCCCQVNIFLHQSYELQRAKFFTLPSQLGLVLHVRTLKLKRKGEFRNTHKAKGHQLCNGQQSAHTLCLRHTRKVSHYTVRIPMTSGPVLHGRTPNWKERQNWNTHKPKGHQKCNGQQSALNPWLPDLELQQPLASYWGIEYRSSSSTNQSKQEYFWTNSEWSTEYRRAFNIDM